MSSLWPTSDQYLVTVVGQDDNVKTAVEADLLEAVHELTHDPVYFLEGQNHLQEAKAQEDHSLFFNTAQTTQTEIWPSFNTSNLSASSVLNELVVQNTGEISQNVF